jgi:predicted RNA-binding Zn-ribbon protein involved in translation (DUF1610 family)
MTSYPICPNTGCHTPMRRSPHDGHYDCPDCGTRWIGSAVRLTRRWFEKSSEAPLPGYWPEIGFEAQTMPGL